MICKGQQLPLELPSKGMSMTPYLYRRLQTVTQMARLSAKSCCPAGSVTLPQGTEMVMPGDNITATFELISPVAMDPGLRFALREGGRTVGAGVVSKVLA